MWPAVPIEQRGDSFGDFRNDGNGPNKPRIPQPVARSVPIQFLNLLISDSLFVYILVKTHRALTISLAV